MGPHTEESASVEDSHMSAVPEVADVIWGESGDRRAEGRKVRYTARIRTI